MIILQLYKKVGSHISGLLTEPVPVFGITAFLFKIRLYFLNDESLFICNIQALHLSTLFIEDQHV